MTVSAEDHGAGIVGLTSDVVKFQTAPVRFTTGHAARIVRSKPLQRPLLRAFQVHI
jgi:hypothetical protein